MDAVFDNKFLQKTMRKFWSSEHRLHVWPEGKGCDLGVVVSHHLPAHVAHHADDGVRGEAGLGRVPALCPALLRRRHRELEGCCEL